MTIYNGEKYLEQQITSILSQTHPADEIIICDDKSYDHSKSILFALIESVDIEIRYYQNDSNLGYVRNFEKAISLCSGDIIFLSDQDDIWYPNKIKVVVEAFNANPTKTLIINNADISDQDARKTGLTKLQQTLSAGLSFDNFLTGCCMAIHRDLLPWILPFPSKSIAHDVWINMFGVIFSSKHVIEDPLQLYRRHDTNYSNWITSNTKKTSFLATIFS